MAFTEKQRNKADELSFVLREKRDYFTKATTGVSTYYIEGILEGIAKGRINDPQPQILEALKNIDTTKVSVKWVTKLARSGLTAQQSSSHEK